MYNEFTDEKKEYYSLLSEDFPEFLYDYINTKEMQRIKYISMDCGCDYTDLFEDHAWHSNLDHSIGVALIIWHFTHDKKQTLSGLFHDIATPTFKHCIDFMNGDQRKQESTEGRTSDIIKNSKEIMNLLNKDHISLEEVDNYHIYPIADNDTPHLAADRLEYNFSDGYFDRGKYGESNIIKIWNSNDLKEIYDDLIILKNEDGIDEIGFKHLDKAIDYIDHVHDLWPWWICDEDRLSMQFYADICREMNNRGLLSIDDLYSLKEEEIIDRILNAPEDISIPFKEFQKTRQIYKGLNDRYYSSHTIGKRRYVNPFVLETGKRVYDSSDLSKKQIDDYLKIPIEGDNYIKVKKIGKK